MSDLIDRQDAIDALAYFTEKSPTGRTAQEVVKALPSAQPNLQPTCNQLATDCISRQAAIDALGDIHPLIF